MGRCAETVVGSSGLNVKNYPSSCHVKNSVTGNKAVKCPSVQDVFWLLEAGVRPDGSSFMHMQAHPEKNSLLSIRRALQKIGKRQRLDKRLSSLLARRVTKWNTGPQQCLLRSKAVF